jgi:hypothetical protein
MKSIEQDSPSYIRDCQKARSKMQEIGSKKQEARNKKQKVKSKKQKVKSKKQESVQRMIKLCIVHKS